MKRAISAKGTYVLNEDELDRLGDLSLTTVIADLHESLEPSAQEPKPSRSEPVAADTRTDRTINELLAGAFSESDDAFVSEVPSPSASYDTVAALDTDEETGDLIAPELVFPELDLKR